MTDQTVSRRNLLKATGLVGLGALVLGGNLAGLRSCQRGGPSQPGGEAGPYAVWREIQTALRASPDHTLGRAKALVEAGDVAAIHRFVRDDIRLISAEGSRFVLGATLRWGARAALRGGAGTAREKAEILADMIRQTGRTAEVLETSKTASGEAENLFFRNMEPAFDPLMGKGVLEDWRRRLGQRPEETRSVDIGAQEEAISSTHARLKALMQQANGRFGRYAYDNRLRGRLPIVRFEDEALGVLYADPITPGTDISAKAGALQAADEPVGLLPVKISLSFKTAQAGDLPVEIARADWTAEDLAGRQVRIGFKPLCDMQTFLASRIGDVRAFAPILSIQALDGAQLDPQRSVVVGESFTLEGDRLALAEDGGVTINGENIGDGAPTDLSGNVVSIDIETDATRFPDMRVLVRPRDDQGRVVDGLSFSDFALSDQGERVSHLLKSRDRAPSILFLSDNSLSMPEAFRGADAAEMRALVGRVEAAAKAIHPKASVVVKATNSNLWEHLLQTLGTKVDLIVYATDGDVAGKIPTAKERAPLSFGPKVIAMNVRGNMERRRGPGRTNPFDEIADATHGLALDVIDGDTSAVDKAVQEFLEQEVSDLPYVLTYHVPDLEGGLRVCGARIGSTLGQAQYESAVVQAPMRKIVSLQLTVRIGNREVTRVMGGHDGSGEPSQEDVNEVHGLVLGTHMLAFEGPPPSLSTVLDDILTARLSIEPVDRAAGEGMDLPGILAVLEKGFHVLPGELATLMMRAAPLSGDAFAFSEQGMRCVLYSAHAMMNSDKTVERVDILPTTNTHVISPDSEVLIDKALDASLRLASAEAALFPVNTFSLLEGKALTNFRAALYEQNQVSRDQRSEWEAYRHALQDTFAPRGAAAFCVSDLSTKASWVLDRETLEVYALLPDGSGGGERVQDIERQLLELDRVVSMLNMLPLAAGATALINPIGGVALAIVAAYGQNLARLYAAASISIILMDASGIAPALRLAVASMACNIVKSIFLGVFSGAGEVATRAVNIFTAADNLIGATGAASPFSCPI